MKVTGPTSVTCGKFSGHAGTGHPAGAVLKRSGKEGVYNLLYMPMLLTWECRLY